MTTPDRLKRLDARVRAGHHGDAAGVPRAIERRPDAAPSDDDGRLLWLLDLLAWAGHGRVAARLDVRAGRTAMPAVILADGDGPLVAVDDAQALARLAARHRAFSQVAARYAALLLAARDQGRPLVVELWDLGALLDGQPPVARLDQTAAALARYHEASYHVGDLATLATRMALAQRRAAEQALPAALVARNPLAQLLGWQARLQAIDATERAAGPG